jgi:integrase
MVQICYNGTMKNDQNGPNQLFCNNLHTTKSSQYRLRYIIICLCFLYINQVKYFHKRPVFTGIAGKNSFKEFTFMLVVMLFICYPCVILHANSSKTTHIMASTKIHLFDSPSRQLLDGSFPISLRVTHKGQRKYFAVGFTSQRKDWNKTTGRYKNNPQDNAVLEAIELRGRQIINEFKITGEAFTLTKFERRYITEAEQEIAQGHDLISWLAVYESEAADLRKQPIATVRNLLIQFAGKKIPLDSVDKNFLISFEKWLRSTRGNEDTTINTYLAILRGAYNAGIEADPQVIPADLYPFRRKGSNKGYNPGERLDLSTKPRAITRDQMKQIEAADLTNKDQIFARDILIFIYYCRGINFVDIAQLTAANIVDGHLTYLRKKTREKKPTRFTVKLLPPALAILDRYRSDDKYLFPIYDDTTDTDRKKRNRRANIIRRVNASLTEVGIMLGIGKLTTYVGRHTYATVLKKGGVSIDQISENLGHSSAMTTKIYLDRFGDEENDQLHEDIL